MKTHDNDINFEIEFCERFLKERPHFTPALMMLGDLYTKKGRFQEGLKIDQQLARLHPQNPEVFYNLACSYSLLNDVEKSFECLKQALALGYEDIEFLQQDDDLKNLRQVESFQKYFEELWSKQKSSGPSEEMESMRIFKDE